MSNVIAIPTHISGTRFLANLLASFGGDSRYPILVVITGFEEAHRGAFVELIDGYSNLPLSIMTTSYNFNFGALLAVYQRTDYEDIFLLPSSCEIVSPKIFDLVFEVNRECSTAFGLMDGVFGPFWHSEIGKYRRPILDKMAHLERYLPLTAIDAVNTEMTFTPRYHALDPRTVVLFPEWVDSNHFEHKCGERRMKIANEYIIKWKGHWTPEMAAAHGGR